MLRGIRNNNPGNIRLSAEKFQGQISPSRDDSFKQFTSMAYGYRAMFVILGTYLSRGINTIEEIVGKWAPPSENSTPAYIATVEKLSGVKRTESLRSVDGEKYIRIVAAMSKVENGVPANMEEVEEGFSLQCKITK